ncbi:MAG: hypothetical protein H6629_16165 [Calditrichae bacterium]|nr:hypothetical protein [Calditrichia bacterium]
MKLQSSISLVLFVLFSATAINAQTGLKSTKFSKSLLSQNATAAVTSANSDGKMPEIFAEKRGGVQNVFYSLILPGAGEWAMGNKGAAKVFFGSEMVLWLGFWGAQSYVNILQNDMESFAALNAGVRTAGKDDQFWIDVGTASDLDEFNHERLLERDIDATYPETAEYQWQWNSEDNRREYLQKRFDRLDWKRRTNWVVGALILNRLVSAIDVVRLLRKQTDETQARKSIMYVDYAQNSLHGETYRLNLSIKL